MVYFLFNLGGHNLSDVLVSRSITWRLLKMLDCVHSEYFNHLKVVKCSDKCRTFLELVILKKNIFHTIVHRHTLPHVQILDPLSIKVKIDLKFQPNFA